MKFIILDTPDTLESNAGSIAINIEDISTVGAINDRSGCSITIKNPVRTIKVTEPFEKVMDMIVCAKKFDSTITRP